MTIFVSLKLLKSISIFSTVSIITSGISFLLLPILTTYLTKSDYGILSLFNASIRLLVIIISMGGINVLMLYLFKKDKATLSSYFKSFYGLILFNSFILTIIISFSLLFIDDFFGIPKELAIFIPIIAFGVLLYELVISLMVYKKDVRSYAVTALSKFGLEIFFTLLFVVIFLYNWKGRISSLVISLILINIFSLIYLKKEKLLNGKFNFVKLKDLLKLGSPLIIMDLATIVLNLSDRFFIEHLLGLNETGVYSIGYLIGSIILIGLNSLTNVFRPMIYEKLENYNVEKKNLIKMSWQFLLVLLSGTLFLIFILKEIIFNYFIDTKFLESANIVLPIACGFFFWGLYSFYVSYFIYFKQEKIIFWISIFSVLLNLYLNYMFIIKFNIIGAAYATFLTYLISGLIIYLLFQIQLKPKLIQQG